MQGSLMIRPVVGPSYYIGLEEPETSTNDLILYPNPVSNTLHISLPESQRQGQMSIFDLMGRLVYQDALATEIPVADFSDGVYFIRLITDAGQVITQKFIIRK